MDTPTDTAWIYDDLPYRVRAAVARIPLQRELLAQSDYRAETPAIESRCDGDAMWEGRLAATRWLIEFIGIAAADDGNPREAKKRFGHDRRIDDFGGALFAHSGPEATVLANVWLGCSRGGSHATRGSGHPPVNEPELSEALAIVVAHLDQQLYSPIGERLASIALRPNPPDKQG